MDLTKEALAHIGQQAIDAAGVAEVEYGGQAFLESNGKVFMPPAPPLPAPLQTVTLAGLIDYAGKLAEGDRAAIKAAHVADPYTVHLLGSTRATWEDRPVYARAVFPVEARRLPIGDFHGHAALVIALQTHFAESADRDRLLELLRAVSAKGEVTSTDDGVGQEVTIKRGVTLLGSAPVPNPVMLRPRRSFSEVEPPEELFVVRLQPSRNPDLPPDIGLFQVGEAWLPAWIAAVGAEVVKRLNAADLGDIPVIA
jgi:hypothetical protein